MPCVDLFRKNQSKSGFLRPGGLKSDYWVPKRTFGSIFALWRSNAQRARNTNALAAFLGATFSILGPRMHVGLLIRIRREKIVQGGKIERFAPKAHPGPLKGIDFHWVFVCPAHGRLLGRKNAICHGKRHPGAEKSNLC